MNKDKKVTQSFERRNKNNWAREAIEFYRTWEIGRIVGI